MERKPEDEYEIQDAVHVDSGIMIQLKLVKGKEEEDRLESKKPDAQLNGDAGIMGRMLSWTWRSRGDALVKGAAINRHVCGACAYATDPTQKQHWYCRPGKGCTAWEDHKNCMHSDALA